MLFHSRSLIDFITAILMPEKNQNWSIIVSMGR